MKLLITTILCFFLFTGFAEAASINAKTKIKMTPQGIKLVCAKKNDKPKKSTRNKKWHLDKECCLDYDEKPNSKCFYGSKYQKLLNKYYKKFGK